MQTVQTATDASVIPRSFVMRSLSAAGILRRLEDRQLPPQIFQKQPIFVKLFCRGKCKI